MTIHIVQKGDTLWNLSKKYNVDFQALKDANSQLANPDMIMPGMKIKIPVDKKQVTQSPKATGPKEKLMTPYKQMPQKAQPVIKEDDQKPKQIIKKKTPFPKLPPMSINMPKLPNIHANQYNIDVDIDDYDTAIKNKQTTQPPVQPKETPVKKDEPKAQPTKAETAQWSPQNMMWMPVMPCQMMFYPQQPYEQMPVTNPCQAYQYPAKLQPNYAYQQPQWPTQDGHTHTHKQAAQWGELDINDEQEQEMMQQMNQQMAQPYYPQQWPTQFYQNQSYPYQYPMYDGAGYQNYATYALREGSNQPSGQNHEED